MSDARKMFERFHIPFGGVESMLKNEASGVFYALRSGAVGHVGMIQTAMTKGPAYTIDCVIREVGRCLSAPAVHQ